MKYESKSEFRRITTLTSKDITFIPISSMVDIVEGIKR